MILARGRLPSVDVSNVLNEEKKQQVIALGRLGWSLRKIQKTTGVRRETAADYLRAAGIGLRPPGGWGRSAPAKPAKEVTPDPQPAKPANRAEVIPDSGAVLASPPAATANASAGRSACEPHRETIELELSKGRNAKGIWQDLVDRSGFAGGYQSVKRFIVGLRGKSSPEACAVIETAPGEECQVDYGSGPMVRDSGSGKYRRTRLFVLTLGYSRKAVRLLVFCSSSQVWAELHEKAFRRLGGVTRVVVLDNLREGVLKPDVYDPTLNPLYRDVLSHYGSVALACRVRDPDRKGKVESGVGHAKKTPLKGQRFETLDEAQAYLDHWEERWADTRIHGTTKRQVAAMFAEEKPVLLPLPIEPFHYYQYASARSIWMAAWKSMPPTTARRQGGSARRSRCNGITAMSGYCTRGPANCCGNTCLRCVASIGSRTRTAPNTHRRGYNTCCCAPAVPVSRLELCAARCTRRRDKSRCAAFRA